MSKKRSNELDLEKYMSRKIRKMEERLKKKLKRRSCLTQIRETENEDPLQITENSVIDNANVPFAEENNVCVPPENTVLVSEDISACMSEEIIVPIAEETNNRPEGMIVPGEPDTEEEALPPEILEILGETPVTEKKYGTKIKEEIAIRWKHTASKGLTKDQRKNLIESHLVPENAKTIDAPLLNGEIKAALSDVLYKKDKAIEQKQRQLASSISCIGEALTYALKNKEADLSLIRSLTDAGKLMCDLQHTESMLRRGYVCSYIKKDIKEQLYNTNIDDYLFGNKLADTLKTAKAINKSGAEMKTQHKHLNWKPPLPPPSRQVGVTMRRPPAATATSTSAPYRGPYRGPPARLPLRRPPPSAHPPPAHPPQRAYSQRSHTQTQPRK